MARLVAKHGGSSQMERTQRVMGHDAKSMNTKWLRLRDALAFACRRLDRTEAKQEICDLVISSKIVLRGERDDRYIFFDNRSHRSYVMPSNIDWRRSRLYMFEGSYGGPSNLCVLNDRTFQNFISGQLTDPKPPGSTAAKPRQYSASGGGRPNKFPWDDVWIEACRYIHYNGLPDVPAELMKHLQQWCEDRLDEQPSDSTLKPKLRKLYTALQQSDEN